MRDRGWVGAALLAAATPAWAAAQRAQDPRTGLVLLLLLPVAACCFTALELVLWVLAPVPLSAASQAIVRGRTRCMVTGLLAGFVVFGAVAVLSQQSEAGQRLAALVLGAAALAALMGLTAVTALLGNGALELAGRTGSRALAVVVGSLLLLFTCVIPIVGWVLGIYLLLVGFGGLFQALLRFR